MVYLTRLFVCGKQTLKPRAPLMLCILSFQMIIYCDVREFKVAVNGVHSLEYRHRFKDLSHIDTLEIDGDIHLLEVRSW